MRVVRRKAPLAILKTLQAYGKSSSVNHCEQWPFSGLSTLVGFLGQLGSYLLVFLKGSL